MPVEIGRLLLLQREGETRAIPKTELIGLANAKGVGDVELLDLIGAEGCT